MNPGKHAPINQCWLNVWASVRVNYFFISAFVFNRLKTLCGIHSKHILRRSLTHFNYVTVVLRITETMKM